MKMDFNDWRDADYYSLQSQTTINSLASLKSEGDSRKFLVSSMECQCSSVEYLYQPSDKKITPVMKTIQFSNLPLPGDAEVIGICVFERLPPKKGLVVGITYIITEEHQEPLQKSQVLNVYSSSLDDDSINPYKLESIAENCQCVTLGYIPFCLKTTVVDIPNGEETPVFLVSGSDCDIHLYKESSEEEKGQPPFVGEMTAVYVFPEFKTLQGIVETLEIANPDCDHRVTALGYQEGPIEVFHVNTKSLEILSTWKTSMDGPITSLHFFTQRKDVPCPPPLKTVQGDEKEEEKDPDLTNLHLLMTVHLQPALVYRDVLHNGLSEVLPLQNSEKFDSCLCSLALDVDFDGENEVIVGTYGQELLVYKFFPLKDVYVPISPQEAARSASPTESGRTLTPVEEASKHRHKSAESGAPEKIPDPQRKVKSQENLLHLSPERSQDPRFSSDPRLSPERRVPMELRTVAEPNYRLQCKRSFPLPIMALGSGDMMKDGVENLVVLTSFGIHILQISPERMIKERKNDQELTVMSDSKCNDCVTSFKSLPDIDKLMDVVTKRLKQHVESTSVQETGDEFHRLQLE